MKPTLYVFYLTLLLMLTLPAQAQRTPPITLGEPIVINYGHWGPDNIVWLDNETLIVQTHPTSEGELAIAYRYHASTGESTQLLESPLYFTPSPEEIEYFQLGWNNFAQAYTAYQSPFPNETSNTPLIIYPSTMRLPCPAGCAVALLMVGDRGNLEEGYGGLYRPLDIVELMGMSTIWARGGTAAIVMNFGYSCCGALHHIELRDDYPDTHIGYMTNMPINGMLAVSADGSRVLYMRVGDENNPQLLLWEMETLTIDGFYGTRTETTIFEAQNDEPYPFTGANFVEDDPTQIIAVHHDGLMRIDIETDERTVINPDLNAVWINQAFLSPDNRYLALQFEGGIYVVETGID
jgi:hypothetical protein